MSGTARDPRTRRWGSAALVSGTVLFGAMVALHPPTVARFPVAEVLEQILATPWWALNHWGLLIAVSLMGMGLVALHTEIVRQKGGVFAPFALIALIVSLTLWSLAFTFEAAGGMPLAAGYAAGSSAIAADPLGPVALGVLEFLWSSILALGYVAASFLSLAVLLWSVDLSLSRIYPPWVHWLGMLGGASSILVQPLGWSFPQTALLWLALPTAAVAVWLLAIGILLWKLRR